MEVETHRALLTIFPHKPIYPPYFPLLLLGLRGESPLYWGSPPLSNFLFFLYLLHLSLGVNNCTTSLLLCAKFWEALKSPVS